MNKDIALKVEDTVKRLVDKVIVALFSSTVFAEETPPANTDPAPKADPTPAPGIDIPALIAQIRQEEKNKLYPDIEKWKKKYEKYKELYDTLTAEKVEQGKQLKELEEKLKGVEDPELIKSLNTKIAELEGKLKEKPDEEAIRKEIRAELEKEQEVKDHIAKVVGENSNVLLSVFTDEITGKTVEEVDTALATALEKSKKTRKDLGLPEVTENKTPPAVPNTPPVANPQIQNTSPSIAVNDLLNMDVTSDEYKQFRKSLGIR